MEALDPKFKTRLEEIATKLQESEEYAKYLDEEEDEDYQQIRQLIEPLIAEIHGEVAMNHPLQLISFEKELLDEKFEGMYLPKILGYSVLRGQVNDEYKYVRPQSHFKDILVAICSSSNFDCIKKRIGQTIQTGFALSSDIWITNLINPISNKKIRYFLQGQKLPRYRVLKERRIGYLRYKNQFKSENYFTGKFPQNLSDLKVEWASLKAFFSERILRKFDNASIVPQIKAFLDNPDFKKTNEYVEMLAIFGGFFKLNDAELAHLKTSFNEARQNIPGFDEKWLAYMLKLHVSSLDLDASAEKQLSAITDLSIDDQVSELYRLNDVIHSKGYVHEDAIEAVKVSYSNHEGLSIFNEVTRSTIFNYFSRFMKNLDVESYSDYFELSKIFPTYMEIFSNQQFNQNLKDLCMGYVKKLLRKYTDKRGKDYQDIKKFVSTNFHDLGFLSEKEIVELFKTRRKKKPAKA